MKFIKYLSLFALLAVFALTSCQKDEVFETEIETPTVEPDENYKNGLISRSQASGEGLDLGCVSIDYPFELLNLDSSTVAISSEDDFINALDNPDNPPLDFVYPLAVTDVESNPLTANNAEELAELFTDCIPNTGWSDEFPEWFFPAWLISYENSCYQLSYPLDLLDVDSVSVTANDEDELIALLADGTLYSFSFPLDLEDEDGNTVTADDSDELFELLAECGPGPGNGGCGIGTFACYELDYPATLLLIDGTTVVVNDDDEFAEVLMTGEFAGFEYPLTLIDEDGNEITVNNEEELHEAMLNCDPTWGGGGGGGVVGVVQIGCYELGFPTSIDLIGGSSVVINDELELLDLLNTGLFAGFGYPLTLIDEDGNEIVVNNQAELDQAVEDCEGSGGGGGNPNIPLGEFFCYDFSYPFSVVEAQTGTEVTFSNAAEWEAYQYGNPAGPPPFDFIYPFTLVETETGDEVTVNDQEEMIEAVEECW